MQGKLCQVIHNGQKAIGRTCELPYHGNVSRAQLASTTGGQTCSFSFLHTLGPQQVLAKCLMRDSVLVTSEAAPGPASLTFSLALRYPEVWMDTVFGNCFLFKMSSAIQNQHWASFPTQMSDYTLNELSAAEIKLPYELIQLFQASIMECHLAITF